MKGNEDFHCWACERLLDSMHEIAQGVCDCCKASIIRMYQAPLRHDDLLSLIASARIDYSNEAQMKKVYYYGIE